MPDNLPVTNVQSNGEDELVFVTYKVKQFEDHVRVKLKKKGKTFDIVKLYKEKSELEALFRNIKTLLVLGLVDSLHPKEWSGIRRSPLVPKFLASVAKNFYLDPNTQLVATAESPNVKLKPAAWLFQGSTLIAFADNVYLCVREEGQPDGFGNEASSALPLLDTHVCLPVITELPALTPEILKLMVQQAADYSKAHSASLEERSKAAFGPGGVYVDTNGLQPNKPPVRLDLISSIEIKQNQDFARGQTASAATLDAAQGQALKAEPTSAELHKEIESLVKNGKKILKDNCEPAVDELDAVFAKAQATLASEGSIIIERFRKGLANNQTDFNQRAALKEIIKAIERLTSRNDLVIDKEGAVPSITSSLRAHPLAEESDESSAPKQKGLNEFVTRFNELWEKPISPNATAKADELLAAQQKRATEIETGINNGVSALQVKGQEFVNQLRICRLSKEQERAKLDAFMKLLDDIARL